MKRTPKDALDYPHLDDALWVIWWSNGKSWPVADRRLSYLSKTQTHVLKGWALFTVCHKDAAIFFTEDDAQVWLEKQTALRGQPYGVNVTTVRELKERCGYTEIL